MSIVTLDEGIAVGTTSSGATGELPTIRRRSPAGPLPRLNESMLWGFDESEERARFERIQRRLIRLEAILFEEFGTRIDRSSRDCLLRLFVACPSVRAPLISSQPDGILTATWRNSLGEELTIRCASAEAIHFAYAGRSPADGQRIDRHWGTYHSPSLFLSANPAARRIAE